MKFFLKSALTAAVVLWSAIAPAQAGDVRVLTSDFPPLTDSAGARKGLLHDVVAEMAKVLKAPVKVEFVDWSEAQAIAKKEPNVLLFPMTRTPKREPDYEWVVKIFDMDRSFATKPGAPAVDTVEQAGKLKAVGVLAKSASVAFLRDKGLTNTVEMPSPLELMQALKDGKVDAVYQPNPFSKTEWRKIAADAPVFGKPIEVNAAYVAASKPSPAINIEEWRAAFEVLQQDGTFEKLLKDYGMN